MEVVMATVLATLHCKSVRTTVLFGSLRRRRREATISHGPAARLGATTRHGSEFFFVFTARKKMKNKEGKKKQTKNGR